MSNPYAGSNPSMKEATKAGKQSMAAQEQGAMRVNALEQTYPIVPYAKDPYDTIVQVRNEWLENQRIQGQFQFGEKDIQYAIRKRQEEEQLAKDIYTSQLFDFTNPAIVAHVRGIYPDYFERQQRYFDSAMEAARTFTRINMQGIQSKEDIDFLWLVKTGVIHVPSGFLPEQLMTPLDGTTTAPPDSFTVYKRGLFNPWRYTSAADGGRQAPAVGYAGYNQINPWATPTTIHGTGTAGMAYLAGFGRAPAAAGLGLVNAQARDSWAAPAFGSTAGALAGGYGTNAAGAPGANPPLYPSFVRPTTAQLRALQAGQFV